MKRLFSEFKPERYELHLEPDRETMTFSGRVIIHGRKTGRPSQRLTLHQKGLKITSAKLTKLDKKGSLEVELERINIHNSYDELRLHGKDMIYPGNYIVEIDFSGKITESMHGIYPCNFELDGVRKQLIATQFESHHAREVFPCIDEPEAKAIFSLILKTPAKETVISNTPPLSQKTIGHSIVTTFEDTPRMSTYLLAFVYGKLEYKEAVAKNGVKVRIYSTPDKIDLTDFGLEVSVKSLDFFEDYFGVPYPLAKMDVIGLPDFSAGAMENWGLITFRETALFSDPSSSGIESKQYVATVVAHEVSHQWFGNLVTMKWWNDLWLNESFANLMEYRAVDEIFPEWKIWEEFTAREMGSALFRDSLPNVQSVRTDVNHPDEISSVFDPSIVYAKGGCLLNMVRNLIGEANFRKGLKNYFEEYKYQNTETKDLWRHLAQASGQEIQSIMHNWMEKPGYPLIELDYQIKSKSFEASQSRLVIGPVNSLSETDWSVPLSASWETDSLMLDKKSQDFQITGQTDYPLVLNHEAASYFVTRYANRGHFGSILKAAGDGRLSIIDRLLLVQSYLLMERACKVPTTDNLMLLQALGGERAESVWSVLAGIIGGVRTLLDKGEQWHDRLNTVLVPIVTPLLSELGWDIAKDETSQTHKLRALAIGLAAGAQDKSTIEEGLKRFTKFSKPSDLAPDIRSNVYYITVRHGTSKDFNKLLGAYKKLKLAEEKNEIAAELSSTRKPAQIKQLLQMITSEHVRPQDAPTWFAWLMRNRHSADAAWQWLTDNWQWVEEKYSSDKSYDRFPRYAAMAFSYPEQLTSYKQFFEAKANTALDRAIKLGIEEIEGRIAWRASNEQTVKAWLANQ